jgi:hypothetical protein
MNTRRLFVALALFLAAVAIVDIRHADAQEARIMILDRHDTDQLKTAYADYKAAQKRWDSVKADVSKRYTTADGKVMPGWEKVQYSADFRAVVPTQSAYATYSYPCWYGTTSSGAATTSILPISAASSSDLDVLGDLTVKEKK